MRKKKKRSMLPKVLILLLIFSLMGNGIFAAMYLKLSRDYRREIQQLQMRVEEYSSLMQEREDSLEEESDLTKKREPLKEERKTESEEITEKESEERITEDLDGLLVDLDNPLHKITDQYLSGREARGEKWAVCVENLENKENFGYNSAEKMQSASVIKVFIMGAVYDRMCYPSSQERLIPAMEAYDGELRYLLEQMITISDNEAANQLITKLGEGDFQAGARVVNQFCRENSYTSTSVGRKFLESNPTGDNYTSAQDCTKILKDIYEGTCVGEEASEKMLGILKQQTNTSKIPSGLPAEVTTANKTGEMPEGYGLGCIENDMAIVFTDQGDYVLTVLSNELGGLNEEAKQVIRQIAGAVNEMIFSAL